MSSVDGFEDQVRLQLRPVRVPPSEEAWRRLPPALQHRNVWSPRRRALHVGLGALLTLPVTAGIAFAGSPELRQWVAALTTGIAGGGTHQGGSGLDLGDWHQAAAQLGLPSGIGPQGDPLVWIIELGEGTNTADWAVVLDAQTGEPYGQAKLRPGT